jgi:hypothetical protein
MTCGKCGEEVSGRKCNACGHDEVPIHEQLAIAKEALAQAHRERDSYRDALYTARRGMDAVLDTKDRILERLRLVGDQLDAMRDANDLLTSRLAAAEARLRKYDPEPGKCEHGVAEGDWCEPCNHDYKQASIEAESEDQI